MAVGGAQDVDALVDKVWNTDSINAHMPHQCGSSEVSGNLAGTLTRMCRSAHLCETAQARQDCGVDDRDGAIHIGVVHQRHLQPAWGSCAALRLHGSSVKPAQAPHISQYP